MSDERDAMLPQYDHLRRAALLLAANLGAETGSTRDTAEILQWALAISEEGAPVREPRDKPDDLPALCKALGLVPRRALEIAVGYHADGMIAAGKAEDPPVLFDREGLIRIGVERALDAAAKEATR